MSKLVHGIGFNSGKYPAVVDGKPLLVYRTWKSMLSRCTEKIWTKHPAYRGVTCSDNFKSYEFFYEWCNNRIGFGSVDENGSGWHLDKDILAGSALKIYSEDVCIFIPKRLNLLLTKNESKRGELPIGVSFREQNSKFVAYCRDGYTLKYLGYFQTAEDAFKAYKTFKEALIKEVANEYKTQLDQRVYQTLMNYEVNITD